MSHNFLIITVMTAFAMVMSGCAPSITQPKLAKTDILDPRFKFETYAEKKFSKAQGLKTCTVGVTWSRHNTALERSKALKYNQKPSTTPTLSKLFIWVTKRGKVHVSPIGSKSPLTTVTILINNHRYKFREDQTKFLRKTDVEALKNEKIVYFNYTNWPHGRSVEGEEKVIGFKKAYNECVKFLNS